MDVWAGVYATFCDVVHRSLQKFLWQSSRSISLSNYQIIIFFPPRKSDKSEKVSFIKLWFATAECWGTMRQGCGELSVAA